MGWRDDPYTTNRVCKIGSVTYTYHGWEDVGDDVVKIYHDIKDSDGNLFNGPWSPYKVPSIKEFNEYVIELEGKKWTRRVDAREV